MNSHIECVQFDISPTCEEDPLPMSDIKTEEDIKSEIKTELEEYDDFSEHSYIKLQTRIFPPQNISLKTVSEVAETQDEMVRALHNPKKKSKPEQENLKEDTNMFGNHDSSETIDEGGMCGRAHSDRKATSSTCDNSYCKHNSGMCTQTTGKCLECNIRKKSFSNRSKLTNETYIHVSEKPFRCDFCSKSFSKKSNLAAHIRIHSDEKLYTCYICTKSFSLKSYLSVHIRTHSKEKLFACTTCSKSFYSEIQLTTHLQIHSNEKPFPCNVRCKSFSDKCIFSKHKHTHTNEKKFICNYCNKSFSRKYNLNSHMFTHKK